MAQGGASRSGDAEANRLAADLTPADRTLLHLARHHYRRIVWDAETRERARRLGIPVPRPAYRNPLSSLRMR